LALFARADGTGDELGKVERCAQRPGFAASNNRLCNLESKPFFAIVRYDLPYFVDAGVRQPLGSGNTAAGIHTHVQRAIAHEGKTPGGIIDLGRRHPQIKHDAVDRINAQALELIGERGKTSMNDCDARILALQLPGGRNGFGILVEYKQTGIGIKLRQQKTAVPATPEGAVNEDTAAQISPERLRARATKRRINKGVDRRLWQHGSVSEFHGGAQKEN
jgi:hypothetical protein